MEIKFKGSSYPLLNQQLGMGKTYKYEEIAAVLYKLQKDISVKGICELELIDNESSLRTPFIFNLQEKLNIPESIEKSLKIPSGEEYRYITELMALEKLVTLESEMKIAAEKQLENEMLSAVVFDKATEPTKKEPEKEPVKYKRQSSRMNHYQRQELLSNMKKKDIISVAESLGMELVNVGKSYKWKEHDSFVFDTRKNTFFWNSRSIGGDTVKLVQLIKNCSFNEALEYLKNGEITEHKAVATQRKFHYFLKDHDNIDKVKQYLTDVRKLDAATVDYFYQKGIIAQADYKNPETNTYEPVLVFKNMDKNGNVKGIAIQGITKHEENTHRPYLKRTLGDGYFGTKVLVGNPPLKPNERSSDNPLKIIAFEAPIDLMSYYEIFKDKMGDCVLVAMNGLRKESISTAFCEIAFPGAETEALRISALDHVQDNINATDRFRIILSVDNDEAGKRFIENFNFNKFPVKPHLPELKPGETKSDWNQVLQTAKQATKNPFYDRVAAATPAYKSSNDITMEKRL